MGETETPLATLGAGGMSDMQASLLPGVPAEFLLTLGRRKPGAQSCAHLTDYRPLPGRAGQLLFMPSAVRHLPTHSEPFVNPGLIPHDIIQARATVILTFPSQKKTAKAYLGSLLWGSLPGARRGRPWHK